MILWNSDMGKAGDFDEYFYHACNFQLLMVFTMFYFYLVTSVIDDGDEIIPSDFLFDRSRISST